MGAEQIRGKRRADPGLTAILSGLTGSQASSALFSSDDPSNQFIRLALPPVNSLKSSQFLEVGDGCRWSISYNNISLCKLGN